MASGSTPPVSVLRNRDFVRLWSAETISQFGSHTTAGFAACMQVWSYVQMPAFAMGAAVSSMAAQNVGAGRWDRVGRTAKAGVAFQTIVTAVSVALITFFARPLLGIFLPEGSPAPDRHLVVHLLRRHDGAVRRHTLDRRGGGAAHHPDRHPVGRPLSSRCKPDGPLRRRRNLVELPGLVTFVDAVRRALLQVRRLAESAYGPRGGAPIKPLRGC